MLSDKCERRCDIYGRLVVAVYAFEVTLPNFRFNRSMADAVNIIAHSSRKTIAEYHNIKFFLVSNIIFHIDSRTVFLIANLVASFEKRASYVNRNH